jgi:hypothetical protein
LFVVFVSLGVWYYLRHRKPRRAKHQINPTSTTTSELTPQLNAWVTDTATIGTDRGLDEEPRDDDNVDAIDGGNVESADDVPTLLTESPYDEAMEDNDDEISDDDDRKLGNANVEAPYDEAAADDVDDDAIDDDVDVAYEYLGDTNTDAKTDNWEAPYDEAAPGDDDDDNDDDINQVAMMVESPYDEAAADDDFEIDEHVVIDLDTLDMITNTQDDKHLATDLDGDTYEAAYDEAAPDPDDDDEDGNTYGNTFEAEYDDASPITDETEDVEPQFVVYSNVVFDQNRDTVARASTQNTSEDTIYAEVIARPLQERQTRTSSNIIEL